MVPVAAASNLSLSRPQLSGLAHDRASRRGNCDEGSSTSRGSVRCAEPRPPERLGRRGIGRPLAPVPRSFGFWGGRGFPVAREVGLRRVGEHRLGLPDPGTESRVPGDLGRPDLRRERGPGRRGGAQGGTVRIHRARSRRRRSSVQLVLHRQGGRRDHLGRDRHRGEAEDQAAPQGQPCGLQPRHRRRARGGVLRLRRAVLLQRRR